MVLQILLRQINLGLFLMVAARRFVLAISIPATTSSGNGDSFFRLPTTLTTWFGYLSLKYQWWCSCRCCLINLMVVCVHKALALRLKIKKGEPSVVFTGLWFGGFGIILRLPLEKYKIVSWTKKRLEDLIDLLVYFSLVFVIDVIVYSLVV